MKPVTILGLSLIPLALAHAELFLNGDMSVNTFGAMDNNLLGTHEDQGWINKSTATWSLTETPGKLTLKSSLDAAHWLATNATRYAFGQVASVSGTGNLLHFKFDWTAASTATGDALKINYQLVGWQGSATTPLLSERFFTGLNFRTTQIRDAGSSTGKVDLLNGSQKGTGYQYVSEGVLTGTAGMTVSEDRTINLSTFGPGDQDLSDYDYIGIKFYLGTDVIDGGGNLVDGSILDNVSLTVSNTVITAPIISHDTGYTLTKIRSARKGATNFIVASSYEGTVFGTGYDGTPLWTNALSGYINHDLWCGDITGDNTNEILTANADGNIYCLNADGVLQWQFQTNSAPMFSVCVVNDTNGTPYVVCGGYDQHIYYLDAAGTAVKSIDSRTYSDIRAWADEENYVHIANFLRPVSVNGLERLAVLGEINAQQQTGSVFLFDVLADLPFRTNKTTGISGAGELRVVTPPGETNDLILIGDSGLKQNTFIRIDPTAGAQTNLYLGNILGFGYRVVQMEIIPDGGTYQYLCLIGSDIVLVPADLDLNSKEVLSTAYAFNDMWKDDDNNILLASAQSGGSCIHIIDVSSPNWKSAYQSLNPPGKIATILSNTAQADTHLASFTRPAWERSPLPVYLMTEGTTGVESPVDSLTNTYSSPIFLGGSWMSGAQDPMDWDRNTRLAANPLYRDRRDSRRIPEGETDYVLSSNEIVNIIYPFFDGVPGAAYWGGHGNDPYYFSHELTKGVIDYAGSKMTVLIYPEIGDTSTNLNFLTSDLLYPLADHSLARGTNANLYIRSKQHFWSADIYHSGWARLVSGDYADIFVAALEETNSKTMELSLAGRLGLWAAGSINQWGARCARDNTSLNRLREFSHQELPNHFLRQMVYNISCGAQYINNFSVDPEYISLYWKLIAKGAIYVPKREEIVSFSPVHLSITNPDEHYLEEGGEVKWIAKYDAAFEAANPMVFSRMNGSWPYAPTTAWDFSRYAAGVKDRGLHYLPAYNNGTVLLTPAQHGVFADTNAMRGPITDHLHPMYKNIMQEFHTDGRHYYSADSNTVYAADSYYTTISNAITAAAAQLPLTVDGDVAWVCAQSSPTHLRLTVVDSGYINPMERTASVTFHTVTPVAITDLLNGAKYSMTGGKTFIDVPLGLFRFIDIELAEPFFPENGWGEFSSDHGLSGNSQADFDRDGETDFYEYGFGGDPTNPAVQAVRPSLQYGIDDTVSFYNLKSNHTNPGIAYVAEWTDDLVNGPWQDAWNSLTGAASTDPGYDKVKRQVYGGTNDHLYFRVKLLGL